MLTENENKVLMYLRNPSAMFREKHSPVKDLSDEEIISLYNKMDAIAEEEGEYET